MGTSSDQPLPPLPPAPPTVARRPRRGAREVSSRYLSTPKPVSISNSTPRRTTPRSGSASGYGSESESESADENRIPTFYFTSERNSSHTNTNRRVVHKLFDEKSDTGSRVTEDSRRRPRPGTPISPSLARNPVRQRQSSTPTRSSSGASLVADSSKTDISNGALCESPTIMGTGTRTRKSATDLRSSLPGMDSSSRASNSLVCRSLNSSLDIGKATQVAAQVAAPVAATHRRVSTEKPPQPPGVRGGVDLKKGKKGKKSEEEIHSLKLMHNRDLQLRFINAKAAVATSARKNYMGKEINGAIGLISNKRDCVKEKRIQLEILTREILLNSILDNQNTYLEDWGKIEKDQLECLSGVIIALENASIRVPVDSDVKVNEREIKLALDDASNFLEPLSTSLQNFVPKADEIESIASDLAKVALRERKLAEECGNMLAFARDLQVKESSLRSSIIQKKQQNNLVRKAVA